MQERHEISHANLDRVIRWIASADSKATTFLAIWAIAATGFGTTVPSIGKVLKAGIDRPLAVLTLFLALGYVGTALISLWRLLAVLHPRKRDLGGLNSALYGESIAS